jgi:hypothetical protein
LLVVLREYYGRNVLKWLNLRQGQKSPFLIFWLVRIINHDRVRIKILYVSLYTDIPPQELGWAVYFVMITYVSHARGRTLRANQPLKTVESSVFISSVTSPEYMYTPNPFLKWPPIFHGHFMSFNVTVYYFLRHFMSFKCDRFFCHSFPSPITK